MSDLSPFEINRLARQGQERERRLREDIQRTAEIPNEIHTVMNCACGVAEGEQGVTLLQVVKADGVQLHIVLQPDARRALLRALEEASADAADSGLELPGS